ncbi:hypothetical protein [Streptomyces olivaceiscleroticus]|uniref:Uncharacterized protein n=1 Tax=Streptomyces olivaceiscleroticus TaxID=68245 RepID=A0ABP3KM26_9ACTN
MPNQAFTDKQLEYLSKKTGVDQVRINHYLLEAVEGVLESGDDLKLEFTPGGSAQAEPGASAGPSGTWSAWPVPGVLEVVVDVKTTGGDDWSGTATITAKLHIPVAGTYDVGSAHTDISKAGGGTARLNPSLAAGAIKTSLEVGLFGEKFCIGAKGKISVNLLVYKHDWDVDEITSVCLVS